MKQIVENNISVLEGLLGDMVIVYCARFIYCGKLIAVDDQFLLLDNAEIVYDTGDHSKDRKEWAASEPTWVPQWRIAVSAIESLGRSPF